jgi:DNA-directed RNA polymerase specialized sigma24 family protein
MRAKEFGQFFVLTIFARTLPEPANSEKIRALFFCSISDDLQSVYRSFCLREQRGEFQLEGRDDLWRLLVQITLRKARNASAHHHRDKRDVGRERNVTLAGDDDDEIRLAVDQIGDSEPTPVEAAVLNEELELRLRSLDDPLLRRIALRKLEGFTNKEIALELAPCTERKVERKLQIIRKRFTEHETTDDFPRARDRSRTV